MNSKISILSRMVWLAGALSLFALAQSALAGTISGSKHDFSIGSFATQSGQRMCVACHAPHKTDTTIADAPLWNHTTSAATYTLYSSSSIKAAVTDPNGSSKLCLSCHDGTVAIDSFGGVVSATGTKMGSLNGGASNLGTNLKASHPIGIAYTATLSGNDPSLRDPTATSVTIGAGTQKKTGTIQDILLSGGTKLECNSCHDVHNTFTTDSSGLVKVTASGSAICLTCHAK